MENKSLQVRTENIFTKLIDSMKKVFKKKETKENLELEENIVVVKENQSDFFEKYKDHQEKPELLNLQNKFETKEIALSEMSDEQIHELNLLYQRQITDLKNKLNNKKNELIRIQNRLKKK